MAKLCTKCQFFEHCPASIACEHYYSYPESDYDIIVDKRENERLLYYKEWEQYISDNE